MNKIVPFNKDLFFKTNIGEITSISLEKEVSIKDNTISGEFILEGDYKVLNEEEVKENFDFKIPYEIKLDNKYDTSNVEVEINDFYYEVKDNKVLSVYIELKLIGLEEIVVEEVIEEDVTLKEERCIEEEHDNLPLEDSNFVTYRIYIMKDGDTIDAILNKYGITKEELESYNDLNELKLGDKIIIPTNAKNS